VVGGRSLKFAPALPGIRQIAPGHATYDEVEAARQYQVEHCGTDHDANCQPLRRLDHDFPRGWLRWRRRCRLCICSDGGYGLVANRPMSIALCIVSIHAARNGRSVKSQIACNNYNRDDNADDGENVHLRAPAEV
jgi:hypothetical protein